MAHKGVRLARGRNVGIQKNIAYWHTRTKDQEIGQDARCVSKDLGQGTRACKFIDVGRGKRERNDRILGKGGGDPLQEEDDHK